MADENNIETTNNGQSPAGAENTGHQDGYVPRSRLNEVIAEREQLRKERAALLAIQQAENEKRLQDQQEWQKLAEQYKSELEQVKPLAQRVNEFEEALRNTAAAQIEQLPEDMRPLVPEYDDPRQTLDWLNKNAARLMRQPAPGTDAGVRGDGKNGVAGLTDAEKAIARRLRISDDDYAKQKALRQRK